VIMQAMSDDVIKIDNGIMRFEGPGRYARNVDLDAEPMKTIVWTRRAAQCRRILRPAEVGLVIGSW